MRWIHHNLAIIVAIEGLPSEIAHSDPLDSHYRVFIVAQIKFVGKISPYCQRDCLSTLICQCHIPDLLSHSTSHLLLADWATRVYNSDEVDSSLAYPLLYLTDCDEVVGLALYVLIVIAFHDARVGVKSQREVVLDRREPLICQLDLAT